MKRVFIYIFLLCSFSSFSQENAYRLRISLLTCSKGDDIASAFGHSAIRVIDSVAHRDIVFNYGTYSFNEPNFMVKFMKGDLDYMLSVEYCDDFVYNYKLEKRSINEKVFNLSQQQKVAVYQFLLDNYREENRKYRYDFLIDNCATRVRDIFNGQDYLSQDSLTTYTFRDRLAECLTQKKWLKFGTDLLLGARVDRKIMYKEEMFLPEHLSSHLSDYINTASGDKLMGEAVPILDSNNERGALVSFLFFISQPLSLFIMLILASILFVLFVKNKRRFLSIFLSIFFSILGIGGIILTLMWFATNHYWTADNWNLLWMNPLFIIPVFMRRGKIKCFLIYLFSAISLFSLIFYFVIPQTYNVAVVPIVILTVLVAFAYFLFYSNIRDK